MAYHTRSNSFPSRPHPLIQEVDEHLRRLRSSKATSTSSSSISNRLNSLQDLLDCVDRLLQLQGTQQALAQKQQQKWANELLDGSLHLLDICSTAKDALSQTKESVQDLQSLIQRNRGDETGFTSVVRKYLSSRKIVKKSIHKAMGNLKGMEKKFPLSSTNKDQQTITIVSKLRDVEAVTVTVIESVLAFISGPKSKPRNWSLVSKIVQSKRIACDEEEIVNEFAEVDAALKSLKSAENSQNQLKNLELCIQDQEEGIECLFRQMINTRVSLLNILSH
ncbi:uncharacterized protein LOC126784035 [Argentina anserina]|uniref:uncharacterized protein LOC126784035 n=1 Tax=Argentina anserina TaxID=57926 RepID=UPI00217640F1|nr:uncharacterized protein LOC126784035 [Potentilla anserina]